MIFVALQKETFWEGLFVEPLMPDRPKVRDQTKTDTGVYPCAGGRGEVDVHFRDALLIRRGGASELATV